MEGIADALADMRSRNKSRSLIPAIWLDDAYAMLHFTLTDLICAYMTGHERKHENELRINEQ